jgi:phosphoribosylanthranilate isomerase
MIGTLHIKVCGMLSPENRIALEKLPIDLFGFILYPPSPRFVGNLDDRDLFSLVSTLKGKTGVFVNEKNREILRLAERMGLTHIQLHGSETPQDCEELRNHGLNLIKAFRIDPDFDFSSTQPYAGVADFFLFDTKADKPGGTGQKFNWSILERYIYETPFFLSGGIGPGDTESIKSLSHPYLYGLDLNSGFEVAPGLKNTEALQRFLESLKPDQ